MGTFQTPSRATVREVPPRSPARLPPLPPSRVSDFLPQQLQAALGTVYTVERELGGGGMSRVFVAEETRFQRKVVVKVLVLPLIMPG